METESHELREQTKVEYIIITIKDTKWIRADHTSTEMIIEGQIGNTAMVKVKADKKRPGAEIKLDCLSE